MLLRMSLNSWVAVALLLLTALVVRSIQLDRLPSTDELYTILAARGWLSGGTPAIGTGVYSRAELYTMLVAGFLHWFGDTLVAARVPSVIFGSLLVVAVFLWVRHVAGDAAAWIATLFSCFSPIAIQISQFARFYALLALMFWLGAVALYAATERREAWSNNVLLGFAAAGCLLVAIHLQPIVLIGVAGLSVWWAMTVGLPRWWSLRSAPGQFWLVSAALAVAVVLLALVAAKSGMAGDLWRRYLFTPLHNADLRNAVWFYQVNLIERYPSLWPLFPFLALLALAHAPRPALFCLIVFAVSFLLLSFAGMKHFQYIEFALAFLFVLFGLGLARVWQPLAGAIALIADEGLASIHPALARREWRSLVIGLSMVFLALANGAFARTLLKPFGIASLRSDVNSVEWANARPLLEPWLANAAVILTPNDVFALYYLGGYDIGVSANLISEFDGRPGPDGRGGGQFGIDPRTGHPVVSSPEAIQRILACFPSGMLVTDVYKWRTPKAISDATADVIQARMQAIELPPAVGLRAFQWQRSDTSPAPADCAPVRALVERIRRLSTPVQNPLPAAG
jgi:hypothetical protein